MSTTPKTWGAAPTSEPRRRRLDFLWAFLIVQALFLYWVVAGGANSHAHTVAACANQTVLSTQDCRSAGDAGTAIGVGIIVALWAAVDVIIGVTYAVVRMARGDR